MNYLNHQDYARRNMAAMYQGYESYEQQLETERKRHEERKRKELEAWHERNRLLEMKVERCRELLRTHPDDFDAQIKALCGMDKGQWKV